MNHEINTYDRRPGEAEDAWAAFQRYRDTPGPRPTLPAFAAATGYPVSRVVHWANGWQWASRVLAWDQRVDAARQAGTIRGVEEMAQRHVELAQLGLKIVKRAMDKMMADLEGNEFSRLRPHEVARLVEVCAKLERLSRGQATERVEGADYSQLDDNDLATLEAIANKIH